MHVSICYIVCHHEYVPCILIIMLHYLALHTILCRNFVSMNAMVSLSTLRKVKCCFLVVVFFLQHTGECSLAMKARLGYVMLPFAVDIHVIVRSFDVPHLQVLQQMITSGYIKFSLWLVILKKQAFD